MLRGTPMPRPERTAPARADRPAEAARPEIKICGVNACQAVAERRPGDVRRVYLHAALLPAFGAFLRQCAANRIAYHVVEDGELERITQSRHHEGVCFIVRERPAPTLRQLLAPAGPRALVYLDGVQNPHNLGAIVRVCAHFGAAGVIAAGAEVGASTAMLRTAEGGGEWVDVLPAPAGVDALQAARAAGYRLVAAVARGEHDLHRHALPARAVILLGSETHGVSPAALRLADETVRIPGTGRLDSLNVACACSVLLGEYWRAHAPA
jgi:TrmH RNA methyltransferase